MARRGDEAQAETLEIVEGVVERVDFQLAAVAGAGIHLADREAAAEPAPRRALDAGRQFGERGVVRRRRRFGQRGVRQAFEQCPAHQRSCPEYEQLNDLLQSGKSATMLPSIAASSSGH